VDHDFAKKAFAGGGDFIFAHTAIMRQKSHAYNV
jgi:hypothetical protein